MLYFTKNVIGEDIVINPALITHIQPGAVPGTSLVWFRSSLVIVDKPLDKLVANINAITNLK